MLRLLLLSLFFYTAYTQSLCDMSRVNDYGSYDSSTMTFTLTQNLPSYALSQSSSSPFYDCYMEQNQTYTLTITDDVTFIPNNAFRSGQVGTINFGNSVTSIGYAAFFRNQITSVTIPDSVTSFGDSAFNSNQLTSLNLGNSVTSIGLSAFQNNQLTSVTIPDSVTYIGNAAFYNNQITSVDFPDPNNNLAIGIQVFNGNPLTKLRAPGSWMMYKLVGLLNVQNADVAASHLTTLDDASCMSYRVHTLQVDASVYNIPIRFL